MKKLMTALACAGVLAFVGCKSVPTEATVRMIGYSGGVATGTTLMQCKIDEKAQTVITNIVTRMRICVPNEGETLQAAWLRVAQEHTDLLVATGELTPQQAAVVLSGVRLVISGYDLLLSYYPEIGTYANLTVAAVDGFSDGFLVSYRPENTALLAAPVKADCRLMRDLRATPEFQALKR